MNLEVLNLTCLLQLAHTQCACHVKAWQVQDGLLLWLSTRQLMKWISLLQGSS
jgi:hypothetical protein